MNRPARLRRRLGALLSLLGILVGLPLLLDTVLERPTLEGLPGLVWLEEGVRYRYFEPEPILRLITLAAWVLWVYAALVTILRALAALALRLRLAAAGSLLGVSTLLTFPPVRWAVDTAIGVTLLATTTLTPPRTTPPAPPTPVVATIQPAALGAAEIGSGIQPQVHSAAAAPARPTHASIPPVPPDPEAPVELTSTTDPATGTTVYLVRQGDRAWHFTSLREYTVIPADSLWRIAERELPNPYWWRTIWILNEGRGMVDYAGNQQPLDKPQFIRPGWVLWLPDELTPGLPVPTPGRTPPPPSTIPPEQSPPTTSSPAPDTPAPDTSAPAHGPPPVVGEREPAAGPAAIPLPSGSVIAGSVALMILVAAEIARRRRRRHRRPQPPAPGIARTDPHDFPLRRRLHRALTAPVEDPDRPDAVLQGGGHLPRGLDGHAHSAAAGGWAPAAPHQDEHDDEPHAQPSLAERIHQQLANPPQTPRPVAVGTRDGAEVTLDLDRLGALALTGPGALGVARAIAVATLSTHTAQAARVLVASNQLLPPPPEPFPGLTRTTDLAAALRQVEVEVVHRTRLLEEAELPDAASLRRRDPAEPMATLLLIAEVDTAHLPLVGVLASLGQRHGLAALLLTPEPGLLKDWVHVAADGTPQQGAGTVCEHLAGVALHHQTAEEASELLAPIAAARQPHDPDHEPGKPELASAAGEAPQPAEQAPEQPFVPPPAQADPDRVPVTVRLLGVPTTRIHLEGREVRTGLRSDARELLGYFILHPEGATQGAVMATLWPDLPPDQSEKLDKRFWNALGNLRSLVRDLTGRTDLPLVEYAAGGYRLQAGVIDADVWRLQQGLTDAHQASDPAVQAAALERAGAAYGGLLAQDNWEWAQAEARSLQVKAADAWTHLAKLREQSGDLDGAVAALEQAIEADGLAEDCYRRLMKLHAARGYPDAVRRAFTRLQHAMDQLDQDPEPATVRLAAELRRSLSTQAAADRPRRRSRRPASPPAPQGDPPGA